MYQFSLDSIYKECHTIFLFLCLTYLSLSDTLWVHPCCYKWHYFILFNGWVIFHWREPSYTVGENVSWYLHCWWECKLVKPLWRTVWRLLKKLKIELSYDPEIPLLNVYPQENMIQKIHAPQCSLQLCLQ